MTTPDINETLRQHRNDIAQKIHEHCDTIEVAAGQGQAAAVKDAVDQVHALADLLVDMVIEPGLDDMARRLDQYAVELAENNEYDGARLVIETAEAFGRRHAQLIGLFSPTYSADAHTHYFVENLSESIDEAAWRERRRQAKESLQYMRREES